MVFGKKSVGFLGGFRSDQLGWGCDCIRGWLRQRRGSDRGRLSSGMPSGASSCFTLLVSLRDGVCAGGLGWPPAETVVCQIDVIWHLQVKAGLGRRHDADARG